MDNTWFFISDTTVLRKKRFHCNSKDVSFPYTLIYERRNNLLMVLSSLLNDTAGILLSDSAPDIMIWQSVIKELEKQKTKIAIAQKEDITINHAKSPVKRKSTFTSRNFRENGKNRKKPISHNLNDDKREQVKESDKIRQKQMRNNLDDDKTEQIRSNDKNRKKNQLVETKDEG